MRNHAYRFNITKLKSKGYTSAQEAIQNPGSNIEYMITVSDKWTQGFNSNGQYLVNTDRKEIKLLQGSITDPVIMLKIELQADDAGNVNLDNVTTRKVRLLGKDKELVSRFFIQTFYSTDNEHLIPIDNGIVMDAIPSVPSMGLNITGNECELPLDNKYWIYATVVDGATLMPREGFLEITIGNIVKYIPFSIIPHTEAIPVDEDGPANCFITPVTYGVYSFDATVIGNGADGIVAETKTQDGDYEEWHFKNAYGEDISVSKNVGITPKSAKLIWQDQENLISQVSFDITINRVAFLSNGAGNGVIAVYDKSDPNAEDANVLWSWHIWHPQSTIKDEEYTNASGEKFQIMHCNLGARSDNAASVGYGGAIYQWGRKDPLWPNNDYRYGDGKTGLFFSTFRGMQKDAVTFEDAIKNPTQFIEADDWFGNDDALWGDPNGRELTTYGWSGEKSVYDPCPEGYRVPNNKTWTGFIKPNSLHDLLVIGSWIYGWHCPKYEGDTVGAWYTQGARAIWWSGEIRRYATNSPLWVSHPGATQGMGERWELTDRTETIWNIDTKRSWACQVRCAKVQ